MNKKSYPFTYWSQEDIRQICKRVGLSTGLFLHVSEDQILGSNLRFERLTVSNEDELQRHISGFTPVPAKSWVDLATEFISQCHVKSILSLQEVQHNRVYWKHPAMDLMYSRIDGATCIAVQVYSNKGTDFLFRYEHLTFLEEFQMENAMKGYEKVGPKEWLTFLIEFLEQSCASVHNHAKV